MRSFSLTTLCIWLFVCCSWFCLWGISYYFIMDPILATVFFPFALRLGLILHSLKKYWLAIYSAEWSGLLLLALSLPQYSWLALFIASVVSMPVTLLARRYYKGVQWRLLTVMAIAITTLALINMLVLNGVHFFDLFNTRRLGFIFLISITSGLMLVPSCYLIWNYLFQKAWVPLTVDVVSRSVEFRSQHLFFFCLLFIANILLQVHLPEQLSLFAPFCLAIPIIVLAFRYGWEGALLGTLLNSIALIAVRSEVSSIETVDLLLSLSAQSITGILLGIGIQHQRDLNTKLSKQLKRNYSLSRQLVTAEESVRQNIARELHDEIGQNITAIRTQASILKRVETSQAGESCSSSIEQLSLNIYDTTKGLLSQLRPKTLDDLGLKAAFEQVIRDLNFEAQDIDVAMSYPKNIDDVMSDMLQITLFRVAQEALNNIAKYAKATEVLITLSVDDNITMEIEDNGVGFKNSDTLKGFGLRGMKERIEALGGQCVITSHTQPKSELQMYYYHPPLAGTNIRVVLPQLSSLS
ncbi:putative UhpB, Signal transduction histidine kinase,glucose-6-phosphate specific [Photobacterium sp. SKA34]|uniref:signal transduction histidine-protein kinase/phosphatase UhpB n=1 Tax=Photobacterium sp. SKA34 TaxID=121723 RepID=UPI00006B781C|nr:signal transduction histidine-protein kinase/phosphatase UhpB [Photobacterium sp. SKA34]EAR55796.1 putative UhpB, Signal transduction histidine kinase,glucose-6-phosphate specific [Photobacterium sp. SKA34]